MDITSADTVTIESSATLRLENTSGGAYIELKDDGTVDINGIIWDIHGHTGSPTAPTGPVSNTGGPV